MSVRSVFSFPQLALYSIALANTEEAFKAVARELARSVVD
jgi:hypothetical protein